MPGYMDQNYEEMPDVPQALPRYNFAGIDTDDPVRPGREDISHVDRGTETSSPQRVQHRRVSGMVSRVKQVVVSPAPLG